MNSTIRWNDKTAKAQNASRMPASLAIAVCNVLSFFDGCAEILRSNTVRFLLKGIAFTAALFYVFGCIGAMESGTLDFAQTVFRSGITLGICALAVYALRIKDEEN